MGKKIISLGQFNDFETTHHDSVVVIKIKNQTIKMYILNSDELKYKG